MRFREAPCLCDVLVGTAVRDPACETSSAKIGDLGCSSLELRQMSTTKHLDADRVHPLTFNLDCVSPETDRRAPVM